MSGIERERFEIDGLDRGAWRLTSASGLELRVAALGGAILSLRVPDGAGGTVDVALGYENPDAYVHNPSYFGVLVGPFANRIGGARFVIDGRVHELDPNDGPNHLHGGGAGFSRAVWRAEPFEQDGDPAIRLEHTSPDGAGGYPGPIHARATYTLTGRNELVVDYDVTAEAPTHVSLTQHSYFNLGGHDAGDVLAHELELFADCYLPVDHGLIPTGELRAVEGTPFDFRTPTALGARIDAQDEQLLRGHGYDHCYVVRQGAPSAGGLRGVPGGAGLRGVSPELFRAARVIEPRSRRSMTVHTSEPGVQLYTGNWLGDGVRGKGGAMYGRRSGFALETQRFPDTPNRPEFPSSLLRPEEVMRSRTIYAFDAA